MASKNYGISEANTAADYMKNLSVEDVKELTETFRQFDKNGDGSISAAELGQVLRALGDDPVEDKLQVMIEAVDANKDGCIDLNEFLLLNAMAMEFDERDDMSHCLREVFEVFDTDFDGFITATELQVALSKLVGEGVTHEEAVRMIKGVDKDGDGRVDFDEFSKMMTGSRYQVC
eukprot:TRINITY_DN1012_c0_g1_i1.p1 TRINITY_DN1012_c0_g1~~TRINITY_DN1012_c0_g1_i1.p1  ORF type:complete len:175 (+),score=63.28 TRINITY_DN1012_c0_g1_i1:152-676(+)